MLINSINSDQIQSIKALKCIDDWDRPYYRIRAHVIQTVDLKNFRDKQAAQAYLDDIAAQVADAGADHIVITSEL